MGLNPPRRHKIASLHWSYDDEDAISDRGVEVSETDDVGGIRFASFADPDGNTWALYG